jgi:hypothetical protein
MEEVVFSLRSGDVRYSYSHFHGPALTLTRHVHEAADAGRYDVISAPETCDIHKVLRRHIRPPNTMTCLRSLLAIMLIRP